VAREFTQMNRIQNWFLGSRAVLGLAFCFIASRTCAQDPANGQGQSTLGALAAAPSDQRTEQARSSLAVVETRSPANEFRIGPDDLLEITVFEAPEMNRAVRVSANGEISLQLLGTARAAGMTARELELVLQEQLRRSYMKDPHVGVFVREMESHPVSVVGAVKKPGVFQIRGSKTVVELLSMAEGLSDDAGDTVLLVHGTETVPGAAVGPYLEQPERAGGATPRVKVESNGEIERINAKDLLDGDDPAVNVSVRPGDIVKVPRAEVVYVVGEVRKPGGFVLRSGENISVLQALALAEGPTHSSAMGHARIIRANTGEGTPSEIPVNLGKILSGKAPDVTLQPKDIVFVPNSAAKSVFYRGSEAALQTAAGVAIYRW